MGKTQTALEYAYRHLKEYAHAFLVNADSREAIISGDTTIAGQLGLRQQVDNYGTPSIVVQLLSQPHFARNWP